MALAQARALLRVSGKCGLGLSDGQIAEQLPKAGGGHPTKQSIQQLRLTIASDPLWFPGKAKPGAQKRGRKPKLTEAKRIRIAKSDTSLKTNENTAATCRILYRRILYRFLGLSDFLRLPPTVSDVADPAWVSWSRRPLPLPSDFLRLRPMWAFLNTILGRRPAHPV